MKTAILLSGYARDYKNCLESLKSNILNYNNCDIFLQTYEEQNIDEKKYIIEKNKDIILNIDEICFKNKFPEVDVKNLFYQWRNVKQSFILIDDTYDCVLRSRFDIKFTSPLYLNSFDMNFINIPNKGDWNNGLFDMLAFSSHKNMKIYCELIDKINNYVNLGVKCHSETLNKYNISTNNIEINRFDYTIILRKVFDKLIFEDRIFTI